MKSKVEAHIQAKAQLQAQIHRPGPGPGPRSKIQCQDFLTLIFNTFPYDFCTFGQPHDTPPMPGPSGGRVGEPPPIGFAPKIKFQRARVGRASPPFYEADPGQGPDTQGQGREGQPSLSFLKGSAVLAPQGPALAPQG